MDEVFNFFEELNYFEKCSPVLLCLINNYIFMDINFSSGFIIDNDRLFEFTEVNKMEKCVISCQRN